MRTNPLLLLVAALSAATALAEEPNNNPFDATFLPAGVLSVLDDMSAGSFPDTLLAATDQFGVIVEIDDDDSRLGNGLASGVFDVPTSSGQVSFLVSGFGDDSFVGDHSEFGDYEAFVTVRDLFGEEVDFFSVTGTLTPGLADDYSFSDFNWFGGTFDVEIDNTIAGGDVDFFTFTGLTPGADFTARTTDPDGFSPDTILGWFDGIGGLIDLNDDADGSTRLSELSGVVPASGEVTLAVTAYDDFDFVGAHGESWTYGLEIELATVDLPGDANGDGKVDLVDLDILGQEAGLMNFPNGIPRADFNGDGNVDLVDLDILGQNFGAMAAVATPEPTAAAMLVGGLALAGARRGGWPGGLALHS